ncbi:MAG: hypothetical protein JWL60_1680 [Gemmatimonadetes bacterium]|nr:hypothetical protein [Gemmatimonadota bacterium]
MVHLIENAGGMVSRAMEDQAHHFARAFLLPAESFADDFVVPSLDTLQVLKLKWNVSMAAMLMRAKDLGLTTEAEQLRFWKTYARKGYKLGEPLDDRVPPEQPAIPRQALTTLLDQGIQTRARVRSALPYSSADIEEPAALPPGFLGDRPQVLQLTLRQPSRPPQREAGATTMLEFPTRSNNQLDWADYDGPRRTSPVQSRSASAGQVGLHQATLAESAFTCLTCGYIGPSGSHEFQSATRLDTSILLRTFAGCAAQEISRYFASNSCIASTAITIDVMAHYGLQAQPWEVCLRLRRHPYSSSVECHPPETPHSIGGHLVACR